MNILIIGGTGLISTAITRQLLQRGDKVTHFNRGHTPVRLPAELPRPALVVGDRRNRAEFEERWASGPRFDVVLDMVAFTPEDAQSAVRAFSGRTAQYIFCSSVDAYRKPYTVYPITEQHPLGGLTRYGQDKAACETLLMDTHGRGLPVTVLRPGHTSGEGGQGLDLFGWNSHYLDRIARSLPLISHGDGTSLWGTCYTEDSARAFIAAFGNPRAMGRAYHLAADEVLTWDQTYAACAKAIGAPPPEMVHIPTDLLFRALPEKARECAQNFQYDNIFDNSEARRDLGFVRTISYVELMRRIHQWWVENRQLQQAEDNPLYDRIIATWRPMARTFVAALADADGPTV